MTCVTALCILMGGWLTSHNYDISHRDAILRYVKRESDFQPNIIERTGICAFQWAGERRRNILRVGNGKCPSWQVQMIVADEELHKFFCGFFHAIDPFYHMRIHFGQGAIERCP